MRSLSEARKMAVMHPGKGEEINSFALVSYIPGPLGLYLDRLRGELVPCGYARAHVTVLPPRPLAYPPDDAWAEMRLPLQEAAPLLLETTQVEVFPLTHVIYLAIGKGFNDLKNLHQRLNRSKTYFDEPFQFHPHITLAQDLSEDQVEPAMDLARRRLAECPCDRTIAVRSLVFVESRFFPESGCNQWVDRAECTLGIHQPTGARD